MSPASQSRILIDDAVEDAVLDLIRTAREYVTLISPYNRVWRHLQDAIHEADSARHQRHRRLSGGQGPRRQQGLGQLAVGGGRGMSMRSNGSMPRFT